MDGYKCGAAVGDAPIKCADNVKACATNPCDTAMPGYTCNHATPATTTGAVKCVVSNCMTCAAGTAGTGCTACNAGFYLKSDVCYTCDANCKTGTADGCGATEAAGEIT